MVGKDDENQEIIIDYGYLKEDEDYEDLELEGPFVIARKYPWPTDKVRIENHKKRGVFKLPPAKTQRIKKPDRPIKPEVAFNDTVRSLAAYTPDVLQHLSRHVDAIPNVGTGNPKFPFNSSEELYNFLSNTGQDLESINSTLGLLSLENLLGVEKLSERVKSHQGTLEIQTQWLESKIQKVTKISSQTKDQLEECCVEITDFLKDILKEGDINSDLLNRIYLLLEKLKDLFYELSQAFLELKILCEDNFQDIKYSLDQLSDKIYELINDIDEKLDVILDRLNGIGDDVVETVQLARHIHTAVVRTIPDILAGISTLITETQTLTMGELFKIQGLTAAIAADLVVVSGIVTAVETRVVGITQTVTQIDATVKNHTNLLQDIKNGQDFLIDKIKELPDVVTEVITANIIGESYYTYDARKSFLPTLIFKFVENKDANI